MTHEGHTIEVWYNLGTYCEPISAEGDVQVSDDTLKLDELERKNEHTRLNRDEALKLIALARKGQGLADDCHYSHVDITTYGITRDRAERYEQALREILNGPSGIFARNKARAALKK
jgi:hypothetical protein